jgi:16S rRNA (adenine1518-N6/adenine1519-N6)-dimethyltransferase
MKNIKPLKRFGQNYLTDKNTINKMIDILNLQSNDSVLELGPGKGSITEELLKKLKKLTAIEIDTRVIEELKNKFPKLNLIQNDFTKISFKQLSGITNYPIKVIGNIPFNLTGDVLFKSIYEKDFISEVVLLMPFDIAKRIVAKKKTKEYGILTILFTYFSTAKLVYKVSRNVFFPKPNIESAIVHIKFNKEEKKSINRELFIKVVKASFGNRRKTLKNSLSNSIFKNCDFSKIELSLTKRAEELNIDDFIKLTEYIQLNCDG